MKKIILTLQTSIKKRFVTGISIMLLPMAVLASAGYILFENVIHSFEEAKTEAVNEINSIAILQKLILKAAMPANDYLIHGETWERQTFNSISKEVDEAFSTALGMPFGLQEERSLVMSAQKEWWTAKAMSERLLTFHNPVGNAAASKDMKLLDNRTYQIVNLLERATKLAHDELHMEISRAYALKNRVSLLIAVILVLGLAASVIIAIALSRSILNPIRALEEGADQFAAGNLSSRIALLAKDELGHLAKTFNAMAEQIERHEKILEDLSIHDGLTELFNKREFTRRIIDEIARSKRYKSVFSLIMIDIDHFKAVNDTYGHQAGDEVLKAISAILKRGIRTVDFAARYGGEEIAVILPYINSEGAYEAAERLRKDIEAFKISISKEKAIQVTVSMGLAVFPDNADTDEKLVTAADKALYAAKHAGRNHVQIFKGLT
ncbi:MAG: diguanylate cyclase [Nitrospirae bacterium]|nr:diguanylate cyclase [Nitrospirota bacterium]